MTTKSSMQSTTLMEAPQGLQISMSILITRLRCSPTLIGHATFGIRQSNMPDVPKNEQPEQVADDMCMCGPMVGSGRTASHH